MRYSFLDNWAKQPNMANLGNDSCKANHPRGPIYYLSFIIYYLSLRSQVVAIQLRFPRLSPRPRILW